MAAFLGSLEYVLEEGPNNDWLQDEQRVHHGHHHGGRRGGVLLARASKVEEPIVDLRAFGNINFAFGSLFSFVIGIGLYGLTYLYPLFLGRIRGYDSMMIGEALFVSGLAMFITAPIAGFLSSKMDLRLMMMIGFLGFAAGTWRMTCLTADWDFYELLVPQILRGVSMMLCMVPINNIALGTLPPERMKNASGLFNLTRNLGGAVGLAVINTVLTHRNAFHYERMAEHVSWGSPEAEQEDRRHGANLRGARHGGHDCGDLQAERHGASAGVDAVIHGRLLLADAAVRLAGRLRAVDAQAAGSGVRRRRALSAPAQAAPA